MDPIPLTLPKRLSDAQTVRLLGAAFDVTIAVLIEGARVEDAARLAGYRHTLTEKQTPSLLLESFVHDREEHRLVLTTHSYPDHTRRVLNLTIPGGMTLEAFERFRRSRECVGCTYYWHAHIYGEWRTEQRRRPRHRKTAPRSPVFIEVRQDVFQGEPLLLRVMFHQLSSYE